MFESFVFAAGLAATPKPAPCTHPPVPRTMIGAPPTSERLQRPYASVRFTVDAAGAVEAVVLDEGTGDKQRDAEALAAAKRWTFLPALDGCRPVKATVTYTVGFGYGSKTFADPCNHETEMLRGVAPEYPESAIRAHLGAVSVSMKIEFDEAARLVGIALLSTSGNADVDRTTQAAVLLSTYSGTVRNCSPAAGTYTFVARFAP